MSLSHIMGGEYANTKTSEQVQSNCSEDTEDSFDITHDELSEACSITLADKSVSYLTGGKHGTDINEVMIYNNSGLVGSAPSLNVAREGHGCTSYQYKGKTYLLIAGGSVHTTRTRIDSVEMMEVGGSQWSLLDQK